MSLDSVDPPTRRLPVEAVIGAPHADAVEVSLDALDAAKEIAISAVARQGTPIRKLFVRSADEAGAAPMAQIYAGGRSGLVALKTYLAIVWRCSAAPYRTDKPTRAWATLLGLPDPEGNGARRVAAAIKTLAHHQLVSVSPQPGHANMVTLLDESGDGEPYEPPGGAHAAATRARDAEGQARNLYFKVPNRLWTEGHIQTLKGPGLVMLLILLGELSSQGRPVWFSTEAFPQRYRISHKTRAAGTRELVDRGLLVVGQMPLPSTNTGSVFDFRRHRNVYMLDGAAVGKRVRPPAAGENSLEQMLSDYIAAQGPVPVDFQP